MKSTVLLDFLRRVTQNPTTLVESRLSERWFTRNRKMGFTDAVCFFFDLRKTSLQTRLNSFFDIIKRGMSMTQQGFSKLRSRFNHRPFELMLREIVSQEYSGSYPGDLKGLHSCC